MRRFNRKCGKLGGNSQNPWNAETRAIPFYVFPSSVGNSIRLFMLKTHFLFCYFRIRKGKILFL